MSRAASSLGGQTVWITGASSGIGEALSHSCARRGAKLVLSARRREELERVAAALPSGSNAVVVPLDLAAWEELPAVVERVLSEVGPVDVMIHNGGLSQRSRAIDTDTRVVERLLRVNFLGAVALTRALLPSMVARRRGRFLVVSSLVGEFGTPLRSAYAASKHALHGYFEALRLEHHQDGLGVTIGCPGFVRTQISVNAVVGDGAAQGTMDEATGKGLSPEDCAEGLLEGFEAGRDEVLVGGRERFAVYAHRYAPGLFARVLRRAKVT